MWPSHQEDYLLKTHGVKIEYKKAYWNVLERIGTWVSVGEFMINVDDSIRVERQ